MGAWLENHDCMLEVGLGMLSLVGFALPRTSLKTGIVS